MNEEKPRLTLWPERVLGPLPGLKEINLICWGLFIGFVIAPILFVLVIQSRTGRLYFRESPVDFIYFYGTGRIANEYSAIEVYDNNLQLKTFNEIQPSRDGAYGTSPILRLFRSSSGCSQNFHSNLPIFGGWESR